MKKLLPLLLLLLGLTLPALAEDVPYLQRVTRPDEMIFSGPGYDEFCVGTVREAGVYTIVEEADDGEGHLWGRLKSGAGWIDLTHVRDAEIASWPVSAAFAEDCPPGDTFCRFLAEDSEYTVWIAFRACKPLTDVQFVTLDMAAEEPFPPAAILCQIPELVPGTPLVAGVVFYGDMTTYGLIGTDAEGETHIFAVSVSGRNGMLVLEKLSPVPAPDEPAQP